MGFPHTDSNVSEGEPSPLADPSRWTLLIEEVRPAAFLVVISSSMSNDLRVHCSPEDIWQETLAQAWSSREQHCWQGSAEFGAWLFGIARNRICDAVRRMDALKRGGSQRATRFSGREGGPARPASELHPHDYVTPSRILIHAEDASAIERALAALPAELEQILRMHLLEDLTMEAIAERLKISVSAGWRRFRKGSELYSRSLSGLSCD